MEDIIRKSIAVVFCLIIISLGYLFFVSFNSDFDRDCKKCTEIECQETDVICGDFGLYHMKLIFVVGALAIFLSIGLMMIFPDVPSSDDIGNGGNK